MSVRSDAPSAMGFDPRGAIREAVAIVCEVGPGTLTDATRFDDLGADSLSRVSIADLVEASAAISGSDLRIDDASLCRMTTLGDLADYTSTHLIDRTLRVAS